MYLYACWIMHTRHNSQIWKWTLKVARNVLNVGEVWNPVCCHGNKTFKLVLSTTFSRMLLQRIKHFWLKLAEISFFVISDQNYFGWVYDFITWLICIFWKLEYLWNEKKYLKTVNDIFLRIQTFCLCFKIASIGKMRFSS